MKIALVVHDYHKSGGHSRYVAELAERLALEHDVHVFANRFELALPYGVTAHHVPAWRARALTTILTFLLPASRRVDSSFDIVHGQGLTLLRQDVITAHICSDAWFKAQRMRQHGLSWAQEASRLLVTPLERAVFQPNRARDVIAISEKVRKNLRSSYGRAQRVHTIHHGVDLKGFSPCRVKQYRASARHQLGLSDNNFVAIYVGDLQKGGAVAIGAVAASPEVHLILVSRSDAKPYHTIAASMGVEARVHFLEGTDSIERFYAAADVLLFPTLYDSFGMVITEAMACGLPVITSRAAGAAELIESGQNGVVIDSANEVPAFAAALTELQANDALRLRMGQNARRTVERMSWDVVAKETTRLYERVLAAKGRGAVTPAPCVAFLVNGSTISAAGIRGQAFAARLGEDYDVRLFFRSGARGISLLRFFISLMLLRPKIVYVVDNAFSGVLAAAAYKALTGSITIVDTGDAIYELAKSMGARGTLGLWLTRQLEALAIRIADHFVVRGTAHKQLLLSQGLERVTVIQDGVDTSDFRPESAATVRFQLGLGECLTVGVLGTVTWSRRYKMAYGWELVELLALLPDLAVKGVLIGSGSGLARLQDYARDLGVSNRIVFAGSIPYDCVPMYLSALDVCLSTQSNDLVGQVRTTGKLPLYMAAGRYVLATDVGEASRVLPAEMLVQYAGVKDEAYPARLALRIRQLVADRSILARGRANSRIARESFDYSVLAEKLAGVFESALNGRQSGRNE